MFSSFSLNSFRTYAIRRIRDAFRENKNVKDPAEIQALVNKARRDLGIIRRQVRWPRAWSSHTSPMIGRRGSGACKSHLGSRDSLLAYVARDELSCH